jgi:hypothetical protein
VPADNAARVQCAVTLVVHGAVDGHIAGDAFGIQCGDVLAVLKLRLHFGPLAPQLPQRPAHILGACIAAAFLPVLRIQQLQVLRDLLGVAPSLLGKLLLAQHLTCPLPAYQQN